MERKVILKISLYMRAEGMWGTGGGVGVGGSGDCLFVDAVHWLMSPL